MQIVHRAPKGRSPLHCNRWARTHICSRTSCSPRSIAGPTIAEHAAPQLYKYIGGIVHGEGGSLVGAGGVEDHVHLLVRCKADGSLSDLMRNVKAKSSRWLSESFAEIGWDGWQDGYGAFSVSPSGEAAVLDYFTRQRERHRVMTFMEELEILLQKNGVAYERRYLE